MADQSDTRQYEVGEYDVDPFYTVSELSDSGRPPLVGISLTAEEYADYRRVLDEFYAWQDRLAPLYVKWREGLIHGPTHTASIQER